MKEMLLNIFGINKEEFRLDRIIKKGDLMSKEFIFTKSCTTCLRNSICDPDLVKACRVWGGHYSREVVDLRLWQHKDKNEERNILMDEISKLKESMQILVDVIENNMPNLKLEQYKKLIERSM